MATKMEHNPTVLRGWDGDLAVRCCCGWHSNTYGLLEEAGRDFDRHVSEAN